MRKIRVALGLLAKVYLIDIGSIAVFTLQFLLFRFRNTDHKNHKNRNFLPCGTGTGTVINYGSGTGTRFKIMYLITFI
jgi:hypothetical protein